LSQFTALRRKAQAGEPIKEYFLAARYVDRQGNTTSSSRQAVIQGSPVTTGTVKAAIDPAVQFADGFDASAYTLGFNPVSEVPLPAVGNDYDSLIVAMQRTQK
jgi:hypothetical protein